jgi:hypothetical protein
MGVPPPAKPPPPAAPPVKVPALALPPDTAPPAGPPAPPVAVPPSPAPAVAVPPTLVPPVVDPALPPPATLGLPLVPRPPDAGMPAAPAGGELAPPPWWSLPQPMNVANPRAPVKSRVRWFERMMFWSNNGTGRAGSHRVAQLKPRPGARCTRSRKSSGCVDAPWLRLALHLALFVARAPATGTDERPPSA